MARKRFSDTALTPNQVVAYNLANARLYRSWTQDQAAEALAPYLGSRMSAASWSAMERSVEGTRVRQFTADDLFAFSRGFHLPLGWFLTPPPPGLGLVLGVATPDADRDGLLPMELLDAVLGVEETLEIWKEYLKSWPAFAGHRARVNPDVTWENLGRVIPEVHDRVDEHTALRAQLHLRQQFGDLDTARHVLESLVALIDALDESAADGTPPPAPAPDQEG